MMMKTRRNYEPIPDGDAAAVPRRRPLWILLLSVIAGCLIMIYVSYGSPASSDETTSTKSVPMVAALLGSSNDKKKNRATIAVQKLLEALSDQLEGQVIFFNHNYHKNKAAHTGVWNENAGAPIASVVVANERDVQLAVPILRLLDEEHGVPFRVKSGGHNIAGFCSVQDGVILSLEQLTALEFDTSTGIATMGPGVTVQQVLDEVLLPYNHSGTLGECSGVAEGGFALSGGFGYLSRKYGLGVDSVLSVRIVLSDGSLVTANNENLPDLFWALRGAGGGNFGVVTSLEYQLHPAVDEVLFVSGEVTLVDMAPAMVELGKRSTTLPGEVTFLLEGPVDKHGRVDMLIAYVGAKTEELDSGEALIRSELKPLFPEKEKLSFDRVSWSETTKAGGNLERNLARSWMGYLFSDNNTVEAWTFIFKQLSSLSREFYPYVWVNFDLLGGKLAEISVNATAFAYRTQLFDVGIFLMVPADKKDAHKLFKEITEKTDEVWPKVSMYLVGTYTNYQMQSLSKDEYARTFWGDNLERLQKVKAKYDPGNTFRHEQSVPLP